jgi:hypothetical protein
LAGGGWRLAVDVCTFVRMIYIYVFIIIDMAGFILRLHVVGARRLSILKI